MIVYPHDHVQTTCLQAHFTKLKKITIKDYQIEIFSIKTQWLNIYTITICSTRQTHFHFSFYYLVIGTKTQFNSDYSNLTGNKKKKLIPQSCLSIHRLCMYLRRQKPHWAEQPWRRKRERSSFVEKVVLVEKTIMSFGDIHGHEPPLVEKLVAQWYRESEAWRVGFVGLWNGSGRSENIFHLRV